MLWINFISKAFCFTAALYLFKSSEMSVSSSHTKRDNRPGIVVVCSQFILYCINQPHPQVFVASKPLLRVKLIKKAKCPGNEVVYQCVCLSVRNLSPLLTFTKIW